MKNISATSYSTYQNCGLQYKFSYILKLLKLPSDALKIGTAYHSCLERFHSGKADVYKTEDLNTLTPENIEIVKGMVEKYIKTPVAGTAIHNEYMFNLNIPGIPVRVIGFIDRIDEDKGVEYKTTSADYKEKDTETIQARIYSYALWKKFGRMMPIIYSVNNKKKYKSKNYKPQEITILRTEEDMLLLEKDLLKFYEDVKKEIFEPKPGTHCYWCPWGNKSGDKTCQYSK